METHPWRATSEARVWTLVVVEAEIRCEGGGASGRAPIRHAVRPLPQECLDEALGFAVGLRPIGLRESVADRPALAHGGHRAGPIGHGIVGEQPTDADAAPPKPAERPLQKGRARRRVGRGEHFGVGQTRRIIDRDMQISQPTWRPRRRRSPWMRCPMRVTRPSRFRSRCSRSPTRGHS